MPDPEDVYSSTLSTTDISNSSIHVPNVCDGNRNVITRSIWKKVKTWLHHHHEHLFQIVWSLKLSLLIQGRDLTSLQQMEFKTKYMKHHIIQIQRWWRKQHVYQVMLNSMQLLPITNISKITNDAPNIPQKRKSIPNNNNTGIHS